MFNNKRFTEEEMPGLGTSIFTALLPVFARDVLEVGAEGLGLLRAAPAFGAALVAFYLAMKPFERRVGRNMLTAIVIYGLAMLGFAFSKIS